VAKVELADWDGEEPGRDENQIMIRAMNMADIREILHMIKVGNIRPEISYESEQDGKSPQELAAEMEEAKAALKSFEARMEIVVRQRNVAFAHLADAKKALSKEQERNGTAIAVQAKIIDKFLAGLLTSRDKFLGGLPVCLCWKADVAREFEFPISDTNPLRGWMETFMAKAPIEIELLERECPEVIPPESSTAEDTLKRLLGQLAMLRNRFEDGKFAGYGREMIVEEIKKILAEFGVTAGTSSADTQVPNDTDNDLTQQDGVVDEAAK